MAIIACWECGREISSSASACPICGAPSKQQGDSVTVVERRDDLIFEGSGARITTTTALINGRTYAVNGITAVSITRRNVGMGKIVGGVVCGFLAFAFVGRMDFAAIVLGLFCVTLIGVGLYQPYFLVLRTAAGDTMALESSGIGALSPIREGIETAIKRRG